MKKTFLKIYPFIPASLFMLSSVSVFAADYIPLEPGAFPGVSVANATKNLGSFLGQVFNWGIALAVVLALVMIIWGGIQYMTTDSFTGKDEGKGRIQEALKGLGLALVSWLLLYTINPDLVNFSGNTLLSGGNPTNNQNAIVETPATSNSNANRGTVTCPTQNCSPSVVRIPKPTPTPGVQTPTVTPTQTP
jgi:hypothetical protein